MSKERPGKARRLLPASSRSFRSLPASSKEATLSVEEKSALAQSGRYEAYRCGVSGESVEDFLSEYLLGCILSPDPSNFSLTCTCGANRARTYLRREWRWKQRMVLTEPEAVQSLVEKDKAPELFVAPALSPAGHSLLRELQSRLLSALAELTEPQQKALYLRLVEGLPFGEIASQTGQTSVAVRVMVRSAQRRLGALLLSSDLPCGEACEYLSLLEREAA